MTLSNSIIIKEVLDEYYIDYDWDSGDRLLVKSEMTDEVIKILEDGVFLLI